MEHRRSNIFIRDKRKYTADCPVLAAAPVGSFPVSAVYASDAAETDMTNTDAQTPDAEDVKSTERNRAAGQS